MKIIFFGTPQIAAYCLEKILGSKHQVVAVVTAEDKPAGRGYKLQFSEVKKTAIAHNLPILQPAKLKNPDFLVQLREYNADLFVVVAFRMLPSEVWQMPPLGTINLHASYLPNYRGAAPINWAIINGETQTGISTFFINDVIDTGSIILQQKIDIDFADNAGTLHDKIMVRGANLLLETLERIEAGNIEPTEQSHIPVELLKMAPKISKQDCKINWNQTTLNVYNFVRGLSPLPTAWSVLKCNEKSLVVKILGGRIIDETHNLQAGQIISTKNFIRVATSDGFYEIDKLIPEGKRPMTSKEFLAGNILEHCFFEN